MLLSEKKCVLSALIALFIKMLVTPWATGAFQLMPITLISYACDALILLSIIIYLPFTLKVFSFVYIIFFILLVSFSLSTFFFTDKSIFDAITGHLRIYSPFLFFAMMASYFSKNIKFAIYTAKLYSILTLIFIVIGLVIFPPSYNRIDYWWPVYFGGIHTTAYMAMSIFFISFSLYLAKEIQKRTLLLIGIVTLLSVSLGWGVRTVSAATLILMTAFYLNNMQFNHNKGILKISFFTLLLILTYLFAFIVDERAFDNFTSGRISMYIEKIDQLSNNTFFSWLIGNGVGSDLIKTEFWWWAAKGAHSDFITFLVEGGLLYLLLTLFLLKKIYYIFKKSDSKFLLIAFIFTGLVSNGYLMRPLPSYLFFFSLALSFALITKKSRKKND